jgi:hypothetical protein
MEAVGEPSCNKSPLAEVRAALDSGLFEEALIIAGERDTRNLIGAELHLTWADILDELGLAEEVILELNLALRDDPERVETYQRLAEVYLDHGQPHRSAKLWEQLVRKLPDQPRYYEELAAALKEARQFQKARDVYQQGLEKTGDDRFKGFLRELNFLNEAQLEAPRDKDTTEVIVPQQHNLVTFTTLFSSREGVYARQWVSPTGESGYTPVQEPLTLKVAENHILANFTIGAYPVRLDNTVNYIAFDLDVAKFAIPKAITSEKAWTLLMNKIHRTACRIVDAGASHDIPVHIEDSGFKGRHCWIFLDTPIPAGVGKKCGELLRNCILPLPPEITVEVFPKQTSVKRGGLGNLIKLPLGIHRRTGKRSLFLRPDGTPYEDQLGFLEGLSKTSRRAIYALIQRVMSQPHVTGPGEMPQEDSAPFDIDDREEPAQRERTFDRPVEPYDIDRDAEFQVLMQKCPVLRLIVDKTNQTAVLSKDETMVLVHTLGHVAHGPEAVNLIFGRCNNADPTLFMKSRLRGNPMSCPKIRIRVPEITSAVVCNCQFDLSLNLYPTPLIHVKGALASDAATPLGITVESLQFQNLVQEYLKLRKQFRETKLLLDRYEERLKTFFSEAGVESINTSMGELKIAKKDGEKVSFILEI